MQITNIPKKINYKEYLEIRGEVVMPFSSFDRLNEEARKK
jgi:DNA ligase (NAD+)